MYTLVCCVLDPLDHIIHSRGLFLEDTIALAMVIPHKIKYCSSHETYDGKVQVP